MRIQSGVLVSLANGRSVRWGRSNPHLNIAERRVRAAPDDEEARNRRSRGRRQTRATLSATYGGVTRMASLVITR